MSAANIKRPGKPSTVHFERGDELEFAERLGQILESEGGAITADGESLYQYHDGIWRPFDSVALAKRVAEFRDGMVESVNANGDPISRPVRLNRSTISNSVKLLTEQRTEKNFHTGAPAGIPFRNGFAVVTTDGIELQPFRPEHRVTWQYPFDLPQSGASAPGLDDFYGEAFHDSDRVEKEMLLSEMHGAALLGVAGQFHRQLLQYGPTRAGKSTWAKLVKASFPAYQISALAPHYWTDQYMLSKLKDSRVNFLGELPEKALLYNSAVKAISSGEEFTYRIPGRDAVTARARCLHIFNVNEGKLPKVDAADDAFFERFRVVTWNRNLQEAFARQGKSIDENFAEKLWARERPQIIRRALDAGVRLLRNHAYTVPASHRTVIALWRGRFDPIGTWLEACTTPCETGTPASTLFQMFTKWAERERVTTPPSLTAFGLRLGKAQIRKIERSSSNYYALRVLDERSS